MKESEFEARRRDRELEEAGLLDPGQPTETAHRDHIKKMEAPFSPLELRLIRHEVLNLPLGHNARVQRRCEHERRKE